MCANLSAKDEMSRELWKIGNIRIACTIIVIFRQNINPVYHSKQ